jgi:mannan endo-1,4-beta-mannosidase
MRWTWTTMVVLTAALAVSMPVSVAVPAPTSVLGAEPSRAQAGFVTREDTNLMLNGERYKFAGINADTWFGCWDDEIPSDAELNRYFGELNPHSMTRLFAYPGIDLSIMDRIVAAAERHDQYLAPSLTDGNGDCAIPQPGDAWYDGGYRGDYFDHIRQIVPRYADSKAIGFWELINEPDGEQENLKTFYRQSSDLIASLDPNHLVGTGSHAAWASGNDQKYIDDHDVPNIDLISMHEYDTETGISHWGANSANAARALNKPWYAGEDGFCCGGGDTGSYEGNADKLRAE